MSHESVNRSGKASTSTPKSTALSSVPEQQQESPVNSLLQLQKQAGNRATLQLVKSKLQQAKPVQFKQQAAQMKRVIINGEIVEVPDKYNPPAGRFPGMGMTTNERPEAGLARQQDTARRLRQANGQEPEPEPDVEQIPEAPAPMPEAPAPMPEAPAPMPDNGPGALDLQGGPGPDINGPVNDGGPHVVIDMPEIDAPAPDQQGAEPPSFWNRVTRKGAGGTTVGDIFNSIGVGSTVASIASENPDVSGGLGIVGGVGVGVGGISQIITARQSGYPPADVVKGSVNVASGLSGVASGISSIASSADAATVLGRISAGAWGLAEAINFVQKANAIYRGEGGKDGQRRDALHALNSLLKSAAGFALASSGSSTILILASILGGLGAVSSVLTGLYKLHEIYKSGRDPEDEDDDVPPELDMV